MARHRKVHSRKVLQSHFLLKANKCSKIRVKLRAVDQACNGKSVSVFRAKTTKIQKRQTILPDEIDEILKTIGMDDSETYTKDQQIRAILKMLKDANIGTYVMCCKGSECGRWFQFPNMKDVLEVPGNEN